MLPVEFAQQRTLPGTVCCGRLIRVIRRRFCVSRYGSRLTKSRFLYLNRGYWRRVALTLSEPRLFQNIGGRGSHRLGLRSQSRRRSIASGSAGGWIRHRAGCPLQQACAELACALISRLSLLCERAHNRLLYSQRDVRRESSRRGRCVLAGAVKGYASGKHFIEQNAKRINIRSRIGLFAANLLG